MHLHSTDIALINVYSQTSEPVLHPHSLLSGSHSGPCSSSWNFILPWLPWVFPWFSSYLSSHLSSDAFGGSSSSTLQLSVAVPQDSALGLLLVFFYTLSLSKLIANTDSTTNCILTTHECTSLFQMGLFLSKLKSLPVSLISHGSLADSSSSACLKENS